MRDLPAVERKSRHEVEHEHEHVERGNPAEPDERRRGMHAGAPNGDIDEVPTVGQGIDPKDAQKNHPKRDERPGHGNAKLRPRTGKSTDGARNPAERPELDAGDLQTVAPRDERMPKLMQDQRNKKRQHTGNGHQIGGVARAPEHFMKVRREQEDVEEKDQKPADTHPNADAKEAHQMDRATCRHISMVGGRGCRSVR